MSNPTLNLTSSTNSMGVRDGRESLNSSTGPRQQYGPSYLFPSFAPASPSPSSPSPLTPARDQRRQPQTRNDDYDQSDYGRYQPKSYRAEAAFASPSDRRKEKEADEEIPGESLYDTDIDITSTPSSSSFAQPPPTFNTPAMMRDEPSDKHLTFTPLPSNSRAMSIASPIGYEYPLERAKEESTTDERWVTIFAFPPSASSLILRNFQEYGEILQHRPQANWMHIQYSTKLQAQRALAKNGKVIEGGLMIGVLPCIDPQAAMSNITGTVPKSAAYHSSSSAYKVQNVERGAPVPSTGIWSTIMEYIFGY